MGQLRRPGLTCAQKTELWDRWQRGESLKAIGRAFGKPSSSIYCLVSPQGGIRAAERRRSRLALTLSEREEISRAIVAQRSIRSIARLLGRAPSTVSREVSRNGGYGRYRAARADTQAWARARRPKRCKLANSAWLRQVVARQLRLNWSPEQIAGWLKRTHPGQEAYQVSHETIYRSLFVQARGVLKKELAQHLRSQRTMRHSRHGSGKGDGRGHIRDMISIRERPASVEDRAVPAAPGSRAAPQCCAISPRVPIASGPASSDADPGDGSRPAATPDSKSTMTAYQTPVQSPSATPHAASDPITPFSVHRLNLDDEVDPSLNTPSLRSR